MLKLYQMCRKNLRNLHQSTHKRHTWNIKSPTSIKKIFKPNPMKLVKKSIPKVEKSKPAIARIENLLDGTRYNEFNIQMLNSKVHSHVFKNCTPSIMDPQKVEACKRYLELHGTVSSEREFIKDVDFILPPLEGNNLEEHFEIIARKQAQPYMDLVETLLGKMPKKPKFWLYQEGWTRYEPSKFPEKVPYPLERALVLDVEVCMRSGQVPTLATAVSDKAWYGWVSESLISGTIKPITSHQYTQEMFIPIESLKGEDGSKFNENLSEPKLIVGHNVMYDRARIKEQYWLRRTATRFLDTMSLHVSVSGMTSYQRAMLKSKNSKNNSENDDFEESWMSVSSLNNLADVYKLYCGKLLNKETRNLFVDGQLKDIQENFQLVMDYCSADVSATRDVLKEIWHTFKDRFPHPCTFAGMLELGTAYLPVNENWKRYIEECELTYNDINTEGKILLSRRADRACELLHDEKYKENIWMWDQDWDIKPYRMKMKPKLTKKAAQAEAERKLLEEKELEKLNKYVKPKKMLNDLEEDIDPLEIKFRHLEDMNKRLPATGYQHLAGYPNWYRKLSAKIDSTDDWTPGAHNISTAMQITPKLLALTWEGYPLHYIRDHGWGLLVPFADEMRLDLSNRNEDEIEEFWKSLDIKKAKDEPRIPLEQLIERCPITYYPPDAKVRKDLSNLDVDSIRKEVQDNIAKKDYYKALKGTNTDRFYRGSGVWCNTILNNCVFFFKLPHKDGGNYKVGNPLAKDFLSKFAEHVLGGDGECAEAVLSIARKLSYWRNNRDRILHQLVVWLPSNLITKKDQIFYSSNGANHKNFHTTIRNVGAIIPQVVVCGTLTRRAVEPTWMTASREHPERIGSELRAMVQSPPGYHIVGADVDSQELWIASALGDAYACASSPTSNDIVSVAGGAARHGATPLGWITLRGSKAHGTDMHASTAKRVGISRDHAKVINYARIYGAGQTFAERLLKQFNPGMSIAEARDKAAKMFQITKGKRLFRLKSDYVQDGTLENRFYSRWESYELAKVYGKSHPREMMRVAQWSGGTESAMFNRLEEIAARKTPETPFLKARLSRALEPSVGLEDLDNNEESGSEDGKHLTTRVNWVVQSGAVDFLHLMLVTMRWLMGDERARFCLSFHDEVRYLVPSEHRYRAALAMHVTNLLVRSFCSLQLGIYDLPRSVAYFSTVEVDTCLRKEALADCRTPSNPHGLEGGYGILHGESLDIYQAVVKAKGDTQIWWAQEDNLKAKSFNTCSKDVTITKTAKQ